MVDADRSDTRFVKLWSAVAASNLGDGLVALAIPWLASLMTRDAMAIAAVALATRLPWLLFSLYAGVLTDRWDRRRLMIVANLTRAVLVGGATVLVVAGWATLPLLYVVAFGLGMCEVVFDNTSQTLVPALVPPDRLERANGSIMGAQMVVAEFVARPLSGALIGVAVSLPFAIDAVTAALSAALIAAIPGTYGPASDPAAPRVGVHARIAEGWRWLWRHALLRRLAIALAVMNGIGAATMATYVLFAQELLGLDGLGFGLLLASGSVGALLGSIAGPAVTRRLGAGPSLLCTVLVPIASFGVTAATSDAVVVGIALAAFSFTAMLWNVVTVSLRQTIIPDPLLGRVNSVYRFFGWGAMSLGVLVGGALVAVVEDAASRELGLRAPFIAGAMVHVTMALTVSRHLTTAAVEAARAEAAARTTTRP